MKSFFVARGDLGDGQGRGRGDLAHQKGNLVTLDHALRLGGGDLWVDRVFGEHFELTTQNPAAGVDFVGGHLDALSCVLTQRAQESGHGGEVADFDRAALRP